METAKPKPKPEQRILRSHAATLSPGKKITIGPPASPTATPHANHATASVEVNRNDQGIETIEVTCACGERIVIRCEYA